MLVCELHCHSRNSYDGYNSINDIIKQCKKNGINTVAITDHDVIKISKRDKKKLLKSGIHLISACEMTSDRQIHIIGLFLNHVPKTKQLLTMIDHIKQEGGLIYIPHPFKPETGLLAVEGRDSVISDYVLSNSSFIELYNGKYQNTLEQQEEIYRLAEKYNLTMVAGSDAHKIWQIGTRVNCFDIDDRTICAESFQQAAVTIQHRDSISDQISLYDERFSMDLNNVRQNKPLQMMLKLSPHCIKKWFRHIMYFFQKQNYTEHL